MAQRTAFLNSDAKGFNKDFHHTWINNYMLKQPGVMFSNYSTKPEFALGNGQISGGKAIIRCTRTTGTFAGEEILACFESTSTENISTAGNKKVYIEIPEVYVNDSTAITDSLTQGANLNVGRIVSSDSYPTHSNYIKLWEITNGDWQNATDVRPEVLRRGKPNTLSYFGGNGEEERIDIDNASLNKYLMSNGAGVAPTWEEGGGGGGGGSGENFKRAFTADEDLLAKSMFGVEVEPGMNDVDTSLNFGTTTATKVFFPIVLSGESFSSLTLNLASVNSPADTLSVRIETLDSNGLPTGTLVNVGAYGTATVTSTAADITVSLSGTVEGLTAHTKAAVVLERTGSASDSNYYKLGCLNETKVISLAYSYNGTVYTATSVSGCVDCGGFMSEAVVQATSLNGVAWIGYCESGALAGNDFTGILQGTIDYEGAITGTKYYLSTTGTLSTTSNSFAVGKAIKEGIIDLGKSDDDESGASLELKIKARTALNTGEVVRMSFENTSTGYRPTVRKTASRGLSLTEAVVPEGTVISQPSQSNVGLKTINVGYNKQLSVFYCNNKLTLCLSDDQLGNYSYYPTNYKADAFDVTSPKRGYAVIVFRNETSGGGQYPNVFAVNCNITDPSNEYGLTVGQAVVLEQIATAGNFCVGVCNVSDDFSDTVAALWTRYYSSSDPTTENGQTMYSIVDIDTSTLALTCTTPAVFNANINDCNQTPFGYLGNGWVGFILEQETVESSVVTNDQHTAVARRYSGGTGAEGGSFGSAAYETLNNYSSSSSRYTGKTSIGGQPHQIFGVNGYVFIRLGNMAYLCERFPDLYIRYQFCDSWSGGGLRYYPVDGGKHLLKVDMERNDDNQRGFITITKFEVGASSLHEIAKWKYNTGSEYINGYYPMPQITEIGNRNLWLQNDKDGDYYLTYISNAGQLIMGNTDSHGGEAIGVVKESVAAGEMATIVVSGLAPGKVNEPGEKIHLQPDGTLSGVWTDYPMGIGVEVGNPGKVLLKALPYSHNYLS